jgi:thiol-disulfide isomerase/thioredoxin
MKSLVRFLFICLLLTGSVFASDNGEKLNEPPSPEARQLVNRAVALAESDHPEAALAALKKALILSPNNLRAHLEYQNIKANFLERLDEVNEEYQTLIRKNPDNPVYLMAVYQDYNGEYARPQFEKVASLAPEWAWAHFAKAKLLQTKEPENAVAELRLCIAKDKSINEAYQLLIEIQERQLKRLDDAIQTAEEMAARQEIRPKLRYPQLWRLRLAKAQSGSQAKDQLRNELQRLTNSATDTDTLVAIRSAYLSLLKDEASARAIEDKFVHIDPTWQMWRAWFGYRVLETNQSGIPRIVALPGRQEFLHNRIIEIKKQFDAKTRIPPMEKLLLLKPSPSIKRIIYEEIFREALRAKDNETLIKYGEYLHRIDATDYVLLAQIALALADKRSSLGKALAYARKADRLTAKFQPAKRSPNTSQTFFDNYFPEKKQREIYPQHRALVLDALGWVLLQMGSIQKAEQTLRRANQFQRLESGLAHWAVALRKTGKVIEAEQIAAQASSLFADSIRRKMIQTKIEDFELLSIDGRKIKLSELKGKAVVINFWATWCAPCISEMPYLLKLYEKYKDKGLEILSISTDEEKEKVRPFVTQKRLTFPVFNEPNERKRFQVELIPTNIFIDKEGTIRYRITGFVEGGERELEVVISELLK